ncbi:hypothetical protein GS426_15685 [Rhodococcus hoagii]|nr:hypothetical protein [Prescottella equi]
MICLASFILSFVALADLLHMTGQPRELSYLFPGHHRRHNPAGHISILLLAVNDDRGKEREVLLDRLAVAAGVSIAGNALHAWFSHAHRISTTARCGDRDHSADLSSRSQPRPDHPGSNAEEGS